MLNKPTHTASKDGAKCPRFCISTTVYHLKKIHYVSLLAMFDSSHSSWYGSRIAQKAPL